MTTSSFATTAESAAKLRAQVIASTGIERHFVQHGGDDWLVTEVDGGLATKTFWSLLSEVF